MQKKTKRRMATVSIILIIIIAIIMQFTVFSPKLTSNSDYENVRFITIIQSGSHRLIKMTKSEEAEFFELLVSTKTWKNISPEYSSEYVGDASDYLVEIEYKDGKKEALYVDEARNAAIRQLKHGYQPPIIKAHSQEIIEYIDKICE